MPSRLRVYGALCAVRTLAVSGFDLRGFNVFRTTASFTGSDLEDAALAEHAGAARMLSDPVLLVEIDLNQPPSPNGLRGRRSVPVRATHAGVLNSVAWWAELQLGAEMPLPTHVPPSESLAQARSEPSYHLAHHLCVRQLQHGSDDLIFRWLVAITGSSRPICAVAFESHRAPLCAHAHTSGTDFSCACE